MKLRELPENFFALEILMSRTSADAPAILNLYLSPNPGSVPLSLTACTATLRPGVVISDAGQILQKDSERMGAYQVQ